MRIMRSMLNSKHVLYLGTAVFVTSCVVIVLLRTNNSDGKVPSASTVKGHRGPLPSSSAGSEWKDVDLLTVTPERLMEYLNFNNHSACKLAHHFGGMMVNRSVIKTWFSDERAKYTDSVPAGLDGQYIVCLDPQPIAPPSGQCLVYSFGINNEWSFDDAMEAYGCQVYSFDPSMEQSSYDRTPNIHFYDLALDKVNQGAKHRTLETIYELLKPLHGEVIIDVLKIDIEWNEWAVLPQLIRSRVLSRVRQLVMEVHFRKEYDLDTFRRYIGYIKKLEDDGMVRFDSKYTPWCPATVPSLNNYTGYICFEIAWYNSKYL